MHDEACMGQRGWSSRSNGVSVDLCSCNDRRVHFFVVDAQAANRVFLHINIHLG